MLDPTPYSELNEVLEELVASTKSVLGQALVGAYLQGSFAVGDFDRHSDADFVFVVADELSDSQVDALQAVHRRIYGLPREWAQHLEGSYFPVAILRKCSRTGELLWYLDRGSQSLIRSDHCNTLVVRWIVREQGVVLAGPNPATLIDPIPVDALRQEIHATICVWGQQILADPDRYANRFYQGFIVLNYCRMLHDFITGHPGSKRAGATWAKATLDPSWSGLIDQAWGGRPNPAVAVREPANAAAFSSTLQFVKSVMAESARYAGECSGRRGLTRA
jgi:predicted nucleotidyltransferase